MTTHRPAAHWDAPADPAAGAADGHTRDANASERAEASMPLAGGPSRVGGAVSEERERRGDTTGPDSVPPAAESRVRDRLALDTAAVSPDPGAPESPAAMEPEAVPPGRHAQAVPAATEPAEYRPGDPDDPVGWVDSLVPEEGQGALPRRVPRHARHAEPQQEPLGEEPEHAAPAAADPPALVRDAQSSDASGTSTSRGELIERLDALAALVRIGQSSVDPEILDRARKLLDQAGTRLRLSTDHTVIALAGGTGSGKSSLFNALCGLDFSRVGITRPTTAVPHACVWGTRGAGQLLDWLEVPAHFRHSRSSELDPGDDDLIGLILLDLPDHDSVRSDNKSQVEQLLGSVDLMVWVLDPQKYADAAIHHRYLADLAGHREVMVAVLNQVDKLGDREAEDCVNDLRRLLENDAGQAPQILTTSTVTGEGVAELRRVLAQTVVRRHASIDRLAADLNRVSAEFAPYGDPGPSERPAWDTVGSGVAEYVQETLCGYVAAASGVTAVASAVETEYERRGAETVAWPLARLFRRLRRDPLSAIRSDFEQSRGGIEGSVGVQWAEVETAIGEAAANASEGLPDGWPERVRGAAKTYAAQLPELLGTAVARAIPPRDLAPSWWEWVRGAQYTLLTIALCGVLWVAGSLLSVLGGISLVPGMQDLMLMVFAALMVVAALILGLLMSLGCRNLIGVAASRLRESAEERGRQQVRDVVVGSVLTPLHNELVEYQRFAAALNAARG